MFANFQNYKFLMYSTDCFIQYHHKCFTMSDMRIVASTASMLEEPLED